MNQEPGRGVRRLGAKDPPAIEPEFDAGERKLVLIVKRRRQISRDPVQLDIPMQPDNLPPALAGWTPDVPSGVAWVGRRVVALELLRAPGRRTRLGPLPDRVQAEFTAEHPDVRWQSRDGSP